MEIFGAYIVGVLMITLVYGRIFRNQRDQHAVEMRLALLSIEAWKYRGINWKPLSDTTYKVVSNNSLTGETQ